MLQGSDPNRVEIETKDPIQIKLVQKPVWKNLTPSNLANYATMIGIFISVTFYISTTIINKGQEKRKYAIESIDKIYNEDFLIKYRIISNSRNIDNDEDKLKTFDLVLNTFHILSVMYNYKIGNRKIIEKAIGTGIDDFTSHPVYIQYKKNNPISVKEIEKMKQSLDKKK